MALSERELQYRRDYHARMKSDPGYMETRRARQREYRRQKRDATRML